MLVCVQLAPGQHAEVMEITLVTLAPQDKPAGSGTPEMKPVPRVETRKKNEPVARPEPRKAPEAASRERDVPGSRPEPDMQGSTQPADGPASGPQESPSPGPGAAGPPSAPAHGGKASDIDTVSYLYLKQVQDIIRKNLRYPSNARRRGIEGTVQVKFTIQGSGRVEDIQIVSSCGEALLDKASLETIRRCSFPTPPRDSMTFRIPVTFRLTEGS